MIIGGYPLFWGLYIYIYIRICARNPYEPTRKKTLWPRLLCGWHAGEAVKFGSLGSFFSSDLGGRKIAAKLCIAGLALPAGWMGVEESGFGADFQQNDKQHAADWQILTTSRRLLTHPFHLQEHEKEQFMTCNISWSHVTKLPDGPSVICTRYFSTCILLYVYIYICYM